MVASTTAFISAARFGLAPTAKKFATPRLKLVERDIGLISNDPSGKILLFSHTTKLSQDKSAHRKL